jgi:hypothetical protein
MFVGVYATRWLADDTVANAAGLPATLPVALAAVSFGRRTGLATGLLAVVLILVWALVQDFDISWLGWVARVVPLLLGGLLGDATERLETAQRRQQELEAAARRHRDADLGPGRQLRSEQDGQGTRQGAHGVGVTASARDSSAVRRTTVRVSSRVRAAVTESIHRPIP